METTKSTTSTMIDTVVLRAWAQRRIELATNRWRSREVKGRTTYADGAHNAVVDLLVRFQHLLSAMESGDEAFSRDP